MVVLSAGRVPTMSLPVDLTSFVLLRVAALQRRSQRLGAGVVSVQTMALLSRYQHLDRVDFISRAQIAAWAAKQT
jgi:hypothetical protein